MVVGACFFARSSMSLRTRALGSLLGCFLISQEEVKKLQDKVKMMLEEKAGAGGRSEDFPGKT